MQVSPKQEALAVEKLVKSDLSEAQDQIYLSDYEDKINV